jgi:vitamin B12 transporter
MAQPAGRRLDRLSRSDRDRARRQLHGNAIGTTIFGNPGVQPERAKQLEAGATANWDGGRFDLAVFQNIISNRIQANTISSTGGVIVQQYQNNQGDIVVQGVEFQTDASVIRTLGLNVPASWNWNVFGNGYYNFKMIDYGAPPAFGTDTATRINQYQAAIGTRFGQAGVEMPWNFQVLGCCAGRCGTTPRSR